MFIRAENFHRLYTREYYDMLTYLGDLGGLMDVVLLFCWFISGLFATRLFQAALVNSTYKVQEYMNNENNYYDVEKFIESESDLGIDDEDENNNKKLKPACLSRFCCCFFSNKSKGKA